MLHEHYPFPRPIASQPVAKSTVLWRELPQRRLHESLGWQEHPLTNVRHLPAAPEPLPTTIRIMLVDKQVIVHAGLRSLLAGEKTMTIVGEATRGLDALRQVVRLQPDVILIDPALLEMDGIELIRQLHAAHPKGQILILTTVSEEQWVQATIQAGAIGYLLKDVLKPDLLQAIRAAVRGEPTLHPAAQRALIHQVTFSPFQELTEREKDVLRLIVQGCSNRAIATTLCLTEGTVKGYVSTILAKLQVNDRTQAALYAVKHRLNMAEVKGA